MLNYARDLKFTDKPDYGYVKRLISTMAISEGIEFDYKYDWVKVSKEEKEVNKSISYQDESTNINSLSKNVDK